MAFAQVQSFTSKECIESAFEFEIKHKGKFFGLIKNKLRIKKDKCELTVSHKTFLEEKWIVDICRGPVHIKKEDKKMLLRRRKP